MVNYENFGKKKLPISKILQFHLKNDKKMVNKKNRRTHGSLF